MAKCETCGVESTENSETIVCNGKCKLSFHLSCVGFTKSSYKALSKAKKDSWTCPACKLNDEKSAIGDLRKLMEEVKRENEEYKKSTLDRLNELQVSAEYSSKLLEETRETNKKLCDEMKSIKEQNAQLLEENKSLKLQISEMKSDIVELQQYSRRLNVEITNLPEVPQENIQDVLNNVMKALEVDLSTNIVASHRVSTTKPGKIKPIIIQFNNQSAKSVFMKAAKSKRLTADKVNSNLESLPIYCNDHLCPELKKLLYECKQFKRKNNFKYCWCKNGKLNLRQSEKSEIFKIKSLLDLNSVRIQ